MNTRRENTTIAILLVLLGVFFVIPWIVQLVIYLFR